MKKLVTLSIVTAMALAASACGKTGTAENASTNEAIAVEENAAVDNIAATENVAEATAIEDANAANAIEANSTNAN